MVTVQEVFDMMKKSFNKNAALEFKKKITFQYKIEGDGGGSWYITLDNGEYQILEGEAERPVITFIYNSVESFNQIQTGEIDGIQAYTQGKIQVRGPIGIAQKYESVWKS